MFGLMGVARMSGQPGGAWSPLRLFAGGEQGAWYDPSDFASMFQDSAGTTPVTAVEQPVGLILDKRLGLVRGSELWNTADVVALNATITPQSGGWFDVTATADYAGFRVLTGMVSGVTYRIDVEFSGNNEGRFIAYNVGGATDVFAHPTAASGTRSAILKATGATSGASVFMSGAVAGETYSARVVSLTELPGNHASQPTAAARPVVSAPSYINYDGIDDLLATTFPNLGSACTIARAVPMVGASILTGQTIGAGVRNDSTNHAGLVIIDRALTAGETTALTAYLDAKAGV